MLSKIKSCGLAGIDGYIIEVETDIGNGIPGFEIVGLGDAAVRESRERVKAAIKNSGLEFPMRKITINLAPANQRKEGSGLDLAIAMGILAATGQIDSRELYRYIFTGELSLDGSVRPVNGILSMAICAKNEGIDFFVLPSANADEAAVVKDITVLPASNIIDIVNHLNGHKKLGKHSVDIESIFKAGTNNMPDFSEVKGQEYVKRALEIAAAGAHNVLMIGSPGSGKTMLAKRIPSILPPLTFEEALEVTKIYSIAGMLPPGNCLMTSRPFRSPHHTITQVAMAGGGKIPKPGEISLAHYGVLFLDELPEFGRDVLEVLRQPLEDGIVTISRANGTLTYPAKTTLICSANPCKCGNLFDSSRSCTCTPRQIQDYLGKMSGPLLDRIDIHIEVKSVKYDDIDSTRAGESSEVIRQRVSRARAVQIERYAGLGIYSNSQLQPSMIKRFCRLDSKGRNLLRNAFDRLGLSARAHDRILKVARTIADMDGSENIKEEHIAGAIQYRSFDRRSWNRTIPDF